MPVLQAWLRRDGWEIQIEAGFEYAVAEPESWYVDAKAMDGNDWFGVELGVMVDGKKLNLHSGH